MRSLRRFTLVELMVVVAILMVLASIAIPQVYHYQLDAKRAELMVNTPSIAEANIAYEAAFDMNVADSAYVPRTQGALNKQKAAWVTGSSFDDLDWSPDGDVYGTYRNNPSFAAITYCPSGGMVFGYTDLEDDNLPQAYYCCMAEAPFPFLGPVKGNCAFFFELTRY